MAEMFSTPSRRATQSGMLQTMGLFQEHLDFYIRNYGIAAEWALRPDSRFTLGDRDNRVCRFCGKTKPEVTFRKDAHALPESIGNKGLFTNYECDNCNQAFGHGCENDFGNWSLPSRKMQRIKGKYGVPSIKLGPENAWRIDQFPTGLKVNVDETEGFLHDDSDAKTLTFHLKRPPYRPAKVAQAFFKMALSVMPGAELENFRILLDWMKPGDVQKMAAPTPVIHTFAGGAWPTDLVRVAVLTRNSDEIEMPYCFFILALGNEMFQVAIPSTERDGYLCGKKLAPLPSFPFCNDEAVVSTSSVRNLVLFSDDLVKDDEIKITLSYGDRVDRAAE
jgi:hypothetical protein